MKVLTVAWLISIFAFSQSFGQPDSRHILMVNNKTYKPMKEIHIGDEVRLILTNSTKVKGHIISIDSTFFTVDNNFVRLSDIRKISTKKRGVQLLGGVLIAGGIATFVSYDPCINLSLGKN